MPYVVTRLAARDSARRFCRDDLAYFFGSDDFDNSTGGGFVSLEVSAAISDGTNDLVSVSTNRVFVPSANETYAYDADGNMTEDARFRYYWNGENRMIRAEEKIASSGRQPYVVTYAYDHMGRNVIKDGAKFIWDEYNIIVEDADSSDATFNTWGLDLDGTMQGAGGVGGLLAVEKWDAVYLPAYDANGNITEYVDGSGDVAAHYAYSAFGKQLLAVDDMGFTHRFSTKPYCPKTLLVEYEFRKYAPNVGRWMQPDANESEESQLLVLLFCRNAAIRFTDKLGFECVNDGHPVVVETKRKPIGRPIVFANSRKRLIDAEPITTGGVLVPLPSGFMGLVKVSCKCIIGVQDTVVQKYEVKYHLKQPKRCEFGNCSNPLSLTYDEELGWYTVYEQEESKSGPERQIELFASSGPFSGDGSDCNTPCRLEMSKL